MSDKKKYDIKSKSSHLEDWPKNIKQFHLENGKILIAVNSEGEAISLAFVPNAEK